MKYVLSLIIISVMFLSGCLSMQVVGDRQVNPMIEITARRVGCFIAKKETPGHIEELTNICTKIIEGDFSDLDKILPYLTEKYFDDPFAYDDLRSLCAFMGVDLSFLDVENFGIDPDMGQIRALKVAASAFRLGLSRCG